MSEPTHPPDGLQATLLEADKETGSGLTQLLSLFREGGILVTTEVQITEGEDKGKTRIACQSLLQWDGDHTLRLDPDFLDTPAIQNAHFNKLNARLHKLRNAADELSELAAKPVQYLLAMTAFGLSLEALWPLLKGAGSQSGPPLAAILSCLLAAASRIWGPRLGGWIIRPLGGKLLGRYGPRIAKWLFKRATGDFRPGATQAEYVRTRKKEKDVFGEPPHYMQTPGAAG